MATMVGAISFLGVFVLVWIACRVCAMREPNPARPQSFPSRASRASRADRAPLPAQEAHIEVPSITKAIVEVMRSEIKTPDEQLEEGEELVLRAVDYGRRSA